MKRFCSKYLWPVFCSVLVEVLLIRGNADGSCALCPVGRLAAGARLDRGHAGVLAWVFGREFLGPRAADDQRLPAGEEVAWYTPFVKIVCTGSPSAAEGAEGF
jgi:hypothetical protein